MRTVPALAAAAIVATVEAEESVAWLQGALVELRATLAAQRLPAAGPAGGSNLATCVARHAIAVDGPLREYYIVSQNDTPDRSQWQTDIGWPIFRTNPHTNRE